MRGGAPIGSCGPSRRCSCGGGAGLGLVAGRPLRALRGDCAVSIFGGNYMQNSLGEVLCHLARAALSWNYATDDHLVATAVSRDGGAVLAHWTMEPEIGIGQRFGTAERDRALGRPLLPLPRLSLGPPVLTTFAVSTGLNWASEVTDVEQEAGERRQGHASWMHYFAPELTFALPSHPNIELMLRMHHRSGVFGLVSDAWGGAQYATVGLRVRF